MVSPRSNTIARKTGDPTRRSDLEFLAESPIKIGIFPHWDGRFWLAPEGPPPGMPACTGGTAGCLNRGAADQPDGARIRNADTSRWALAEAVCVWSWARCKVLNLVLLFFFLMLDNLGPRGLRRERGRRFTRPSVACPRFAL
jgi:hypothetical protein